MFTESESLCNLNSLTNINLLMNYLIIIYGLKIIKKIITNLLDDPLMPGIFMDEILGPRNRIASESSKKAWFSHTVKRQEFFVFRKVVALSAAANVSKAISRSHKASFLTVNTVLL